MAEIICPQCKAKNRGTSQFCVECGAPLLRMSSEAAPSSAPPKPPAKKKPAAEQASAEAARVLQNRYKIELEMGRGGFGAVYRAWDSNLNRPCAVKENLEVSPEATRQFMREATVLANLSHPNLPRVIDHFIVPEQGQYLVMDFVEGDDLASILSKQEILPVEQALEWIIQVAGALDYLHGQEPPVLHRDIKPANIRLTPKGKVMLVDFGLVKLFDPHLKTTMGGRAVTPGYAPPEQYGQGITDARTDIYALGATLYNLVTGHEPMESVTRMSGEHMLPAHLINPSVPLALSDVIERAMALKPAERYQNAAEFKAALLGSQEAMEKERSAKKVVTVVVEPEIDAIPAPALSAAQAPAAELKSAATIGVSEPVDQKPPSAPLPAERAAPPAAKPAAKKNWLLIGIGAALAVVVCLVAASFLAAAIFSDGKATATKTPAAVAMETLTAAVVLAPETQTAAAHSTEAAAATKTALSKATQTAKAEAASASATNSAATGQAKAQATDQALKKMLAGYENKATQVFGPKSGRILHKNENGYIETYPAGVGLRSFIAEVTFIIPYEAGDKDWDFGLVFRHNQGNIQYRLVFYSDKSWQLTNHVGPAEGKVVAEGKLDTMNVEEGGENKFRLYAIEERGWLFFNDQFVAEFDLSIHYSGGIMIGIGFKENNEWTGKLTEYEDFSVWSVP